MATTAVFSDDLKQWRAGFAGSIVMYPCFSAACGLACAGVSFLPPLILALCGRLFVGLCVERAFSTPRQDYWLLPLYELLAPSSMRLAFLARA